MSYKTIINIDNKIHDDFVKNHPLCNLLQSSQWSKVKDNWGHFLFSVVDGDDVVASSLVLVKNIKRFSIFYIPRGPIMDYTNTELVKYYFDSLKQYAKQQHCIFIKIDPAIILAQYQLEQASERKEDESSLNIIQYLRDYGFIYHGQTKHIKDTFQPRYVMGLYKDQDYKNNLPRRTQKAMRSATKKGVEVGVYDLNYVDEFARLMKLTEQRKGVNLRNEAYFTKLLEVYPQTGKLYLTSVDVTKRYDEVVEQIASIDQQLEQASGKKTINKLTQEKQPLEKELEELVVLKEKYPNKEFIAGGLMIGFGDQMELLYAGMNEDFKHFNPQYLTYTHQFDDSFMWGYDFCSMGGVEGSLDDGLSIYKSAYNPYVIEYIGEFDLVLNKAMYLAYDLVMKFK